MNPPPPINQITGNALETDCLKCINAVEYPTDGDFSVYHLSRCCLEKLLSADTFPASGVISENREAWIAAMHHAKLWDYSHNKATAALKAMRASLTPQMAEAAHKAHCENAPDKNAA